MLIEIRNALIHSEPKHAAKLFSRKNGDDERGELWYYVGSLVQQALLASIGYEGKMLLRDSDARYAANAVEDAPWIRSK